MTARGEPTVLVLYVTTVAIWGTTWLAMHYQIGVVAPELSAAYRFAIATVAMLAYTRLRGISMSFPLRTHLIFATLGLFIFSLNFLFMYYAATRLTSGLLAVVFSTITVWNILNGAIFLRLRAGGRVLIGAGLGLIGLALVFWRDLAGFEAAGLIGLALAFAGAYSASLGATLSARNQAAGMSLMSANAWGMIYGTVFLFAFSLATGAPLVFDDRWTYIVGVIYLGVFGSAVAFGTFLALVGRIGADRAAYAAVLFPVIALALSTVFENYVWHGEAALGVAIILVGNVIVLRRPASQAR